MQTHKITFKDTLINSTKSFMAILPSMLAIIALVGLFEVYVPPKFISSLFGINPILDLIGGTFIGAISTGHGSISFIIAQGLQQQEVSIYALSTFTLSWVTLDFIQLPLEATILGKNFTIARNILAFISTIIISLITIFTLKFLGFKI